MACNWLDGEISDINADVRKSRMASNSKKMKRKEILILMKFMVFLLIFFCFLVSEVTAKQITNPQKSLFPETWRCKKCGFDNFKGTDSCCVCGNSRWSA